MRLEAPPPTVKGPTGEAVRPEVVLRDAASGKDALPNHALVDLKVEPALQAGPRAFQFTFTVKNFGEAPLKDLEAAGARWATPRWPRASWTCRPTARRRRR